MYGKRRSLLVPQQTPSVFGEGGGGFVVGGDSLKVVGIGGHR